MIGAPVNHRPHYCVFMISTKKKMKCRQFLWLCRSCADDLDHFALNGDEIGLRWFLASKDVLDLLITRNDDKLLPRAVLFAISLLGSRHFVQRRHALPFPRARGVKLGGNLLPSQGGLLHGALMALWLEVYVEVVLPAEFNRAKSALEGGLSRVDNRLRNNVMYDSYDTTIPRFIYYSISNHCVLWSCSADTKFELQTQEHRFSLFPKSLALSTILISEKFGMQSHFWNRCSIVTVKTFCRRTRDFASRSARVDDQAMRSPPKCLCTEAKCFHHHSYIVELILLSNTGQYNFHDPLNNDTPLLVAPSWFTSQ